MFSKIVRRSHMYLALILFPWMLMYGLSTLVMNHRAIFIAKYGRGPAPFEKERELTYQGSFPENAEPQVVAQQILDSLDLDGAHTASRRKDGAIVINRNGLLVPRRLIYTPSDRKIVMEKMQYRANAMLERYHRRRGYATGYGVDTAWAISVDLVIIAMVFWVLSGLWMWWEMKVTRIAGALAVLTGSALFALFLATI
jgi:hypothetical protein